MQWPCEEKTQEKRRRTTNTQTLNSIRCSVIMQSVSTSNLCCSIHWIRICQVLPAVSEATRSHIMRKPFSSSTGRLGRAMPSDASHARARISALAGSCISVSLATLCRYIHMPGLSWESNVWPGRMLCSSCPQIKRDATTKTYSNKILPAAHSSFKLITRSCDICLRNLWGSSILRDIDLETR